jgi:hypothetical protein
LAFAGINDPRDLAWFAALHAKDVPHSRGSSFTKRACSGIGAASTAIVHNAQH